MTLYNAKPTSTPGTLRVTKFDEDLNPISSYETSAKECTCPAGFRSTCRHRNVYPMLSAIANTGKFYEWETGRIREPIGDST